MIANITDTIKANFNSVCRYCCSW